MSSKNRIFLMGWLGADPELKTISGNNGESKVVNVRMSTKEVYKDKEGQRQEKTFWHNLTIWGVKAEFIASYAKKGSHVDIEGRLNYNQWVDDDQKERVTAFIDVQDIILLDKKPREEAATT